MFKRNNPPPENAFEGDFGSSTASTPYGVPLLSRHGLFVSADVQTTIYVVRSTLERLGNFSEKKLNEY